MPKNNRKDISSKELEYLTLSLISNKTRVLIVGGGKAGYIKARTFAKKGCTVWVVSKNFYDKFDTLKDMNNLILIRDEYEYEYIINKHIVIIATDNEDINMKIKNDCEKNAKIYLYCNDFKEGMFVTPVSLGTKNISFSLNTNSGSPKTSLFLLNKVQNLLNDYDDYVSYVSSLRNSLRGNSKKDEIMDFVNTDDFYFFYKKGMQDKILNLFYGRLF